MKKLIIASLILTSLHVNFANASNASCEQDLNDCVSMCNQVIEAGERAIQACRAETDLQRDLIIKQDMRYEEMRNEIDKLQGEKNSWYRNPLIIGLLGFTAGVLLNNGR